MGGQLGVKRQAGQPQGSGAQTPAPPPPPPPPRARSRPLWACAVRGSFFGSLCLGRRWVGRAVVPRKPQSGPDPRDLRPSVCRVSADGAGMGRRWVGWPPRAMPGVPRRLGDTQADAQGGAPWVGRRGHSRPPLSAGAPQPRRAPRPAHTAFSRR